MDVKIKGNKFILTKELTKEETYKLVNKPDFQSVSFYRKPDWVKGYSSMCEDGQHILMIDYDNASYRFVRSELQSLISLHDLTEIYVFTSKEEKVEDDLIGNYHAVCLSKFYPFQITSILSKTHCDYAFRSMPLRKTQKCWVLRISGKGERTSPKFKEVLLSTEGRHTISSAHKDLLEKVFRITPVETNVEDNLKKVYIQEYQTANRLKEGE